MTNPPPAPPPPNPQTAATPALPRGWLRDLLRAVRMDGLQPRDPRVKALWDLLRRRQLLGRDITDLRPLMPDVLVALSLLRPGQLVRVPG